MDIRKILSYMIVACLAVLPVSAYATSDISTGSALRFDEPISVIIEDDNRGGGDDLVLRSVNVSNERITSNDANGFKAVMLSLIGDYETVITDYTYQSGSSGYYSHSISIERDWSWIWSCIMFIVCIYCTFRAVGGILCR